MLNAYFYIGKLCDVYTATPPPLPLPPPHTTRRLSPLVCKNISKQPDLCARKIPGKKEAAEREECKKCHTLPVSSRQPPTLLNTLPPPTPGPNNKMFTRLFGEPVFFFHPLQQKSVVCLQE